MADLPPDLARLGDQLVAAAGRTTRRRVRRRRFAVAVAAGALAFAALTPAGLGPAQRDLTFVEAAARFAPPGCDQPRGARFTMPAACERASALPHPKPWY
jgi:hypothetical protein